MPSSKRVLEPIERIAEILFGLIMVLTFTGSLSAAESGHAEVRTMLIGALGCNLAWGLIDAIMYLMASLSDRASEVRVVSDVRRATSTNEVERAVSRAVPPIVVRGLAAEGLERIRAEVARAPDSHQQVRLIGDDWLGAAAVFLLVFASTIPVVLPFMLLSDPMIALRTSNVIAVAMMFALGWAFGRLANYRPWVTGGSFVLLGAVLVAMTIALGG